MSFTYVGQWYNYLLHVVHIELWNGKVEMSAQALEKQPHGLRRIVENTRPGSVVMKGV